MKLISNNPEYYAKGLELEMYQLNDYYAQNFQQTLADVTGNQIDGNPIVLLLVQLVSGISGTVDHFAKIKKEARRYNEAYLTQHFVNPYRFRMWNEISGGMLPNVGGGQFPSNNQMGGNDFPQDPFNQPNYMEQNPMNNNQNFDPNYPSNNEMNNGMNQNQGNYNPNYQQNQGNQYYDPNYPSNNGMNQNQGNNNPNYPQNQGYPPQNNNPTQGFGNNTTPNNGMGDWTLPQGNNSLDGGSNPDDSKKKKVAKAPEKKGN